MIAITWLGHSGFRIESGDAVVLIDPWLRGNPVFDEAHFDAVIEGATHILVTHGHGDHISSVPEIAKATGAEVVCIYDLAGWLGTNGVERINGMNKGGTVPLGSDSAATMVHATHSSTIDVDGRATACGSETGFMIRFGKRTIYFAGDTDVMADMAVFQDLHAPEIGILPIGGHFTMDARRAAYACDRFFKFRTVIPCHYKTFPLLAQDASELIEALGTAKVRDPEVMERLEL